MKIPVLVERLKRSGYRARGSEPFAFTVKGATREEALSKMRAKIQAQLEDGIELAGIEVGTEPNPWVEFAGMFKDDPMLEEWKKGMAEYRQKVEEDPDYL